MNTWGWPGHGSGVRFEAEKVYGHPLRGDITDERRNLEPEVRGV
jgi:hypothetical protein